MAWYDPRDWDDYAKDAYGAVKKKLQTPMRQGDPEFRDPNLASYQLPGFKSRDRGLTGFADTRGDGPFRGQQSRLANYLGAQVRGQNSLARAQLGQDLGRLQAQQQSMAAGARPSQSAMAARLAMQNTGNIGAQVAGQSQLAQIAERNAAANALGGVLGQARGQDLSAYLGAQQLALQNAQAQQGGMMGYENARTQRYLASLGVPSTKEGLVSALGGALGAAGTMGMGGDGDWWSDVRLKENIRPAGRSADQFLDALGSSASTYRYKPETGLPRAERMGPMAQAVQRVAPEAVIDTPAGKAIDYSKLGPAMAAGLGRLNQKLDDYLGRKAAPRQVRGGEGAPPNTSIWAESPELAEQARREAWGRYFPPNVNPRDVWADSPEGLESIRRAEWERYLARRQPPRQPLLANR